MFEIEKRTITYKQPKGTKDFVGAEQQFRESIIERCKNVFKLYDVQPMDSPTFELTDVLLGKRISTHQH